MNKLAFLLFLLASVILLLLLVYKVAVLKPCLNQQNRGLRIPFILISLYLLAYGFMRRFIVSGWFVTPAAVLNIPNEIRTKTTK